jgi:hypothetical protein
MTLGLWQQPARPLPFWVRPVRGETTMSYVFRLATANELVRPTTLLRSIGQPSNVQPHQFMLRDGFEVKLNAPAQQRLAVFAGIPLQRLARCLPLPAFIDGADDHGTPRLAIVGAGSQTRSYCTLCVARLPGTPPIKVYHGHAPVICPRHHRWLGIPTAPGQFDLSNTPRDHHRQPTTRQAVAITARPAMDRHPVPGRRMGHHRLVGHGAPALAPAAGRALETAPRLYRHRHGPHTSGTAGLAARNRGSGRDFLRSPMAPSDRRRQLLRPQRFLPARRAPPWPAFRVGHRRAGLRRPARVLGRSTQGPSPRHLPRRLAPSNPSRANTR